MVSNALSRISARSSLQPETCGGRVWHLSLALTVAAFGFAIASVSAMDFFFVCLVALCLATFFASPMASLTILLVLAPCRALIETEARLNIPLDVTEALLITYCLAWLLWWISRREPLPHFSGGAILAGTLALCVVFSPGAWVSASLSAWLREWLKWLLIAFMIWHISLSLRGAWRWLVFAIILSACANALVGLYIFFGGSGADHLLILGRFFRAFGTFGQPNPFGGFMGLALPLCLMCAYSHLRIAASRMRANRTLSTTTIALCAGSCMASLLIAAALLASWSRGAWLGSGIALGVMLVALPRRARHGLAAAFAFTLIVAGLWFSGILPNAIIERVTTAAADFVRLDDIRGVDISPTNYAVVERIAHWQAALNMAETAPWLGVGLGNYDAIYAEHRLLNWDDSLGHAHNLYLNLLAEGGFLGLAGYISFCVMVGACMWRIRRHPDAFARGIGIGLLGAWAYLAAHSVFDNLYVNNLFLHIGVLLSLAAILNRQANAKLIVERR